MVLYGIKVRIRMSSIANIFLSSILAGEANVDLNRDKYPCFLSKMIQYWRQTWNQRTNGTVDIEFPFGVVQVSVTQNR